MKVSENKDLPEDTVNLSEAAGSHLAEPEATREPRHDRMTSELATVIAERDMLASEKAELRELMLRRQADHENFRRRTEKDRLEFAEYASMDAVKALLPILDD